MYQTTICYNIEESTTYVAPFRQKGQHPPAIIMMPMVITTKNAVLCSVLF